MIEMTWQDAKAKLAALMRREELTISPIFVPFSQSRNAKPRHGADKPWRSLNWRVTLHKGSKIQADRDAGKQCDVLTADYSAGLAHCPAHKVKLTGAASSRYLESIRLKGCDLETETGHVHRYSESSDHWLKTTKRIEPEALDVFASLVCDSDVLDAGGFETWARDLGYDTDSRSAEAIYRECLEHALKLRSYLGDAVLTEARELAQQL